MVHICNFYVELLTCLFIGEYVASGSDDGRWFIWEKRTGRLMKMLNGDESGNIVFLWFWDFGVSPCTVI